VFSVQVDKIRNGVKIGSVRHDFQLPVVDCSPTTPPVPIITLNASPIKEVAICPGDKVTLETSQNPRWIFQWQKDGDNIAKANSSQLNVTSIGSYNVVKSFNDQCVNDTTSAIVIVKYKKDIDASIVKPKPTCLGDSMRLDITSSAARSFEWFFANTLLASTNPVYVKKKGVYFLKESPKTALCNVALDSIVVSFEPLPLVAAVSAPVSICLRDTAYLQTTGPNNWTYQWFRNQSILPNQINQLVAVRDTGNYYVQVSNTLGCKNLSKAYRVNLKDDCRDPVTRLQVPEIFTPNADGINDTWLIRNLDLNPESIVTVFNRWGEVVFYSDNYTTSPWDGTFRGRVVETGVYAYTIQLPKSKYTMRGQLMVMY
jgi:gliding motility-associated-like protein